MDCTTALEAIQDALDGRLSAEAAAALDAHVAACPACAAEQRAFAGLRSALRALPEAKAAPGFADGVMAGLAAAGPKASPGPGSVAKPRGRVLRVRFALAAAAVAAAVVVVAVSTGGPPAAREGGLDGAELARHAAAESDDPVTRAKRILDERVSGSGAPLDDAESTKADAQSDASDAVRRADADGKARDAKAPAAPAPQPSAPATPQAPGRGAAPSSDPAPGGDPAPSTESAESADSDATGTRRGGRSVDPAQEKSADAPAGPSEVGPSSGDAAAESHVVYAVFATERDALAFVEALRVAAVPFAERTAGRKEAVESKDKSPDRERTAPGTAPGIAGGGVPRTGGGAGGAGGGTGRDGGRDAAAGGLGGGGGAGGAGAQRAGESVHGFGAGRSGFVELGRLTVPAMTSDRRAALDRAAASARGRIAESLVPKDAREPSDPPTDPRLADGPATPSGETSADAGGDAGAPAAKRAPAEVPPPADAGTQTGSTPAKRAAEAPAAITLVIVVGQAPLPPAAAPTAPPAPPTKR